MAFLVHGLNLHVYHRGDNCDELIIEYMGTKNEMKKEKKTRINEKNDGSKRKRKKKETYTHIIYVKHLR